MPEIQRYHLELLARMYAKRIMRSRYKPIKSIAAWCKWETIVAKFGGPKIKKAIKQLANWRLVNLHGKKTVASLTQDGIIIANEYLDELESLGLSLDDSLD